MPRLIAAQTDERVELGDLVEMLETGPFDPADDECFASWGGALKKLANNRDFLADFAIEELKQRCAGQLTQNQYGAQVIMLHTGSDKFMIRANFWPGMTDSIVRNSGTDPFFYGMAHDHNFSFLTVGYLGPGYWSDYFEYDYGEVTGYTGEKVDLRFVERSRLDLGKVMLYRAHRDVHLQLPADSMSISLNILGVEQNQELRDQYRFNIERMEIEDILSRSPIEPLLALSAYFGGQKGEELLESFAAGHPSERIRFAALKARAAAAGNLDQRLSLYERATTGSSAFVRAMAKREAERIEKGRAWIEGDQAPG